MNPVLNQFNYILNQQGIDMTINGVIDSKCLVKEKDNGDYNDRKTIYASIGKVRQGDVIDLLGEKWIVVSKDIGSQVYDVLNLELTKYTINFNFEGEVIGFPTITNPIPKQLDNGEYVALYSGTLVVTLQENEDSKRIALDQRLINQGQAWKITGWDKSKKGLMTLMCEVDIFDANDDKENEIPDRWLYETKHEYVLTILDGDLLNMTIGTPQTLSIGITDLDVEVTPLPQINYLSSDESILTVDTSGEITPVSVGNATISATMNDVPTATDSISVVVEEAPIVDNFAVSISSSNGNTEAIKLGQTLTYTANITNNGEAVTDKAVNWTVNPSTYTTIQSQTDTTIILKATSNFDYAEEVFILKAELSDDITVSDELNIMVDYLF